jgi:alpha-beta hydrolase superfamily lysophospholipase
MVKVSVRKIKPWFIILLSVYIVSGILLYFLQEHLLFRPQTLSINQPYNFQLPFKEVNLPVNAEKNLGIVQFTVPDSLAKGVVLYFHGNRKNIIRYAPFADNFTRNQYEVWMVDYPGFGKSTGKLTEQIMYNDAALLYQMARARFSKDSIIIYGKSLGTGVASQLASVKDCKQLILETPYYSIESLMNRYAFIYPINWLSKYHFPNYKHLKAVEVPVTILHGTSDEIIPFNHSVKLVKENPAARLIPIEKGKHNTLDSFPSFHRQLDSLLQLP